MTRQIIPLFYHASVSYFEMLKMNINNVHVTIDYNHFIRTVKDTKKECVTSRNMFHKKINIFIRSHSYEYNLIYYSCEKSRAEISILLVNISILMKN